MTSLGTKEHTDSARQIQRDHQNHQGQDHLWSLRTVQLILPVPMVLRLQERWEVTAHRPRPTAP
jgi:hypothetical protein